MGSGSPSRHGGDDQGTGRRLWRLSGMGVELVSHIVAGLVLGWLVDHWTGMDPTWKVAGAIAGLVVGMTNFIRTALKASRDSARYVRRAPPAREPEEGDGESGGPDEADDPGD